MDLNTSLAIIVAVIAAALMGLAIQRGGTCMVAAVEELVDRRRYTKALALGEAAIWVSVLLALAMFAGFSMAFPANIAVDAWVVAGGALLGIGALMNGACVIGSVARLGSGNWHYVLTPVGYFLGCLLHDQSAIVRTAATEPMGSAVFRVLLIIALSPVLAFRIWRTATIAARRNMLHKAWTAHEATVAIGFTFALLAVAVGPWTYTDALTRLAHRMMGDGALPVLLYIVLLAGAVVGGWQRRNRESWRTRTAFCCLGGGAIMGFGASLIPGGNDSLILIGLPMFHAYAWIAIATMVLAISTGLLMKRRLQGSVEKPEAISLP